MKNRLSILLAITLIAACTGCKHQPTTGDITLTPESGTSFKTGQSIPVKASYPADMNPDSVVYLLDSVRIGTKKDSTTLTVKTDSLALGSRTVTAKIYKGGKSQDLSINVNILPAKAPEEYTFQVVKKFPHDTSCYTEGLVYQDGFLYESGGGYLDPPPGLHKDGQSSLRKVDLTTGKVVQKAMIDPKVFGEGFAITGDKIIQLTWTSKIAYLYDKSSLKLLKTIPFSVGAEGWGMTADGNKLYFDDSTNRIWFLNKDTYQQTGYIDVFDDKGPVNEINELEYVDGKIYANVYQTDNIIVIDPKTGAVLQKIDFSKLYPQDQRAPNADVLNGIAWDAQGKRLFVTGKKWPNLYQVKIVKK
jgi:glutamine cyclotransferase